MVPATVSVSSWPSQLLSHSIARVSRWVVRVEAGEPVDRLDAGERVDVGLNAREVLERMLLALAEQLLDPPRPVAVQPLGGDVVGVVVADDPVVGGDEEALRRVDDAREVLERDGPLPLELARPAGLRQVGAAARADRQLADQLVADVSVAVRPQHVERRRRVWLGRGDQLLAVARPRCVTGCRRQQRVLKRRPGQRQRLLVVGAERLVHDRPVVGDRDVELVRLRASLDPDLLAHDLGAAPLALELVEPSGRRR